MSLDLLRRFVRDHRPVYDLLRPPRDRLLYLLWIGQRRPLPPPHVVKARRVQQYGQRFGSSILIETGTFLGGMLEANKRHFDHLYSIELSDELYRNAVKKFEGFEHISILHGDSTDVLPRLLKQIDRPCVFWLDGHYSEAQTARGTLNTPIVQELDAILSHPVKDHVVLIDDARCFVGENDYPTIDELKRSVQARQPEFEFAVEEDIIRIHPPAR